MRRGQIQYGWLVVATLSVTETVTWGIVYYGYPVFLHPMEEALGPTGIAPTLAPFIAMLGAANGMSTLARATSICEIFGPQHYGAISGATALGANGARAIGPVGASLLLLAL